MPQNATTTTTATTTAAPAQCYTYDVTPGGNDYTWQEGRDYCQSRGGELAYHGLDTIEKRT